MTDDDRDFITEMVGAAQLQAAMLHSLLEFLADHAILASHDHDILFDTAEFHLDLLPPSASHRVAERLLSEWRRDGLLRSRIHPQAGQN